MYPLTLSEMYRTHDAIGQRRSLISSKLQVRVLLGPPNSELTYYKACDIVDSFKGYKVRDTEDSMIVDVKAVRDEIGEIPSKIQYRKFGNFASSGIEARFGSWNRFLIAAFGVVKGHRTIQKTSIKCGNPDCNKVLTVRENNTKSRFCSKSCSNHANPRRKRVVISCILCGRDAIYRRRYCDKCIEGRNIGIRKVGSFRSELSDANRYSRIRAHARKIAEDLPDRCEKCGYDKHVQVCHRKPIKLYEGSATVQDVNEIGNLVKLCPNHHWELDHGLLVL